ncbi:hypothetical protein J433_04445 [Corynebacterium glutamicum MT]|uniref:Uncharacterized protein n=2 Tax=Corynebacterium glutamicum TaxID=1718 RepID=A0AB36IFI1_CORGT|nr:hypothetical protein [Corynebacterium glutamicum]AGN18925.1 hypothetical protein C624_06730 [Corynebacterium glutamicum SCgG1]AGN21948.1 hypothetical protein C629_06730 [Corynebacterium glutamicum SCgG2]EGV41375.1 hypothetical protein CgS9114_03283 [Corynebacterium glutamicum S9114]EOA65292.1 hypothetical protein J433_04445 [Corynebacterium glutamicum MT]EPP40954.1 hypothetical protein A583_06246 [Corynebacterium glutamicum Z188]
MKLRSLVTSVALVAVTLGSTLTQPAQAFTVTIDDTKCSFFMTKTDDERMQKWFEIRRELGRDIAKQLKKDLPNAASDIQTMIFESTDIPFGLINAPDYGDVDDRVFAVAEAAGYNTTELSQVIEEVRFAIWTDSYDNSYFLEESDSYQEFLLEHAPLILKDFGNALPERPHYTDPQLSFADELVPFITAFDDMNYPLAKACADGGTSDVFHYFYELEQAELKEKETSQFSSGSSFGSS